jgi:hypothetical protein
VRTITATSTTTGYKTRDLQSICCGWTSMLETGNNPFSLASLVPSSKANQFSDNGMNASQKGNPNSPVLSLSLETDVDDSSIRQKIGRNTKPSASRSRFSYELFPYSLVLATARSLQQQARTQKNNDRPPHEEFKKEKHTGHSVFTIKKIHTAPRRKSRTVSLRCAWRTLTSA